MGLLACLLFNSAAYSQNITIEEVVVTANKKQESLQEVGIRLALARVLALFAIALHLHWIQRDAGVEPNCPLCRVRGRLPHGDPCDCPS